MGDLPDRPIVTVKRNDEDHYVFRGDEIYTFELPDFINATVEGELLAVDGSLRTNFENCMVRGFACRNIRMEACDLLDTHIADSIFEGCDLDQTHLSGCHVSNTTFKEVRFFLTNHTETVFVDCVFEDCFFERFIFKYCRFRNCRFDRCRTTNRLFDTCTLFDGSYIGTQFQLATVSTNLGLKQEQFRDCQFRTDRVYEDHEIYELGELGKVLYARASSQLETVAITYFLNGADQSFHEQALHLFDNANWLGGHVSKTVTDRLTALASLLSYTYERNELLTLVLFRFQDFLNSLSRSVAEPAEQTVFSVIQTIDGLRLQVARQLQLTLDVLDRLGPSLARSQRLYLEGDGPVDVSFFEDVFAHLGAQAITVVSVKPRNSPISIEIDLIQTLSGLWLVAAILVTRFKYEVLDTIKLDEMKRSTAGSGAIKGERTSSDERKEHDASLVPAAGQRFSLKLGSIGDVSPEIGLQAVAVFSSGICHHLHISFSIARAMNIRKYVLALFKLQRKAADNAEAN